VVLKIADGNLVFSFFMIGAVILVLGFFAALFIKQPPAGYLPKGYAPAVKISAVDSNRSVEITPMQAIFTSKFAMIWVVFFVNITAGIMFISFQSPMMQDLWSHYRPGSDPVSLAAIGGTLIAVSSIFNGIGRFFWGGVSDKIGRIQTFRLILASQLIVFVTLLFITNPYIFAVLVCYVLLCYGGGFGTMPAYIRDVFSERLMPVVYGTILTAWSAGGVLGPQIVGYMKDNFPQNAANYAFSVGSLLLATGFVLTLFLNNRRVRNHSGLYKRGFLREANAGSLWYNSHSLVGRRSGWPANSWVYERQLSTKRS